MLLSHYYLLWYFYGKSHIRWGWKMSAEQWKVKSPVPEIFILQLPEVALPVCPENARQWPPVYTCVRYMTPVGLTHGEMLSSWFHSGWPGVSRSWYLSCFSPSSPPCRFVVPRSVPGPSRPQSEAWGRHPDGGPPARMAPCVRSRTHRFQQLEFLRNWFYALGK